MTDQPPTSKDIEENINDALAMTKLAMWFIAIGWIVFAVVT